MHPKFERASSMTGDVIGAAIEVHKILGPRLLEAVYEWALLHELELRGFAARSQEVVRIEYKGAIREEILKFDVLVEDALMVEVKAVERVIPIHKAKLMTYMRLLDAPVGLMINFHESKLTDGVSRYILPGANKD